MSVRISSPQFPTAEPSPHAALTLLTFKVKYVLSQVSKCLVSKLEKRQRLMKPYSHCAGLAVVRWCESLLLDLPRLGPLQVPRGHSPQDPRHHGPRRVSRAPQHGDPHSFQREESYPHYRLAALNLRTRF